MHTPLPRTTRFRSHVAYASGLALRAARSVRLWSMVGALAIGAMPANGMGLPPQQQPEYQYGRVGVVGEVFKDGETSCGGTYHPAENVIFHPTLPCGTNVRLYNPANGKSTQASVTNQAVMFRPGHGRVADISISVAEDLGLNSDSPRTQQILIQPVNGSLQTMVSKLPENLPSLSRPHADKKDIDILTRNLIAECGNCSSLGMLGVARVTLNRVDMGFMGASNVRDVVYAPNQFSWVKHGPFPSPSHANWQTARELAEASLTDDVSGDGLGLFYRLGRESDHYYAASIKRPAWAAGMNRIAFATPFERETLRHRYYASTHTTLASR